MPTPLPSGSPQPHRATGPALESDVEDLYAWHGIVVAPHVVTHPERITLGEISATPNAEVRRVLIERYGYERYPKAFLIDELRCIFCGYCVEACPCDAIRMDTAVHMPPGVDRSDFLYDKETLLSIPGRDGTHVTANPRHEPGDASHPGIDRDKGH